MKLTVAVDTDWLQEPAIQELVNKGHTVVPFVSTDFDLVLSAKAWNWNYSMWKYLDVALKGARKAASERAKNKGRKVPSSVGKAGKRPRKTRKPKDEVK